MKNITLTLNPSLDRTMYFPRAFAAGALNRASEPSVTTLGSKGINVSRVWKTLGVDSTAFIFSGGDNGRAMERMLRDEGVDFFAVETEAQTRLNVKMIDPDGVCTEANERGGPITDNELAALTDALLSRACEGGFAALGGSVPQGAPRDVYRTLVELLRAKKMRVILDCDGEALKLGLQARPWLIKPNLYELSGLVGRDVDPDSASDVCRCVFEETGVEVLCTMSEHGAVYASSRGVFRVTSPQGLTVRGFTGAGDTFLAAFTATLDATGDPVHALRFASSAAACKITLPGSAIPAAADMSRYLSGISVSNVSLYPTDHRSAGC